MISAFQITAPQFQSPTNNHGIDPNFIALGGWVEWIKQVAAPEIEWLRTAGEPRLLIHNCFACPEGPYQFSQFLTAKKAGLLTAKGFAKAWRPVTEMGVQVIFYIGTYTQDKAFSELSGPYQGDDFMRRALESVQPIIDAGGSIGFDASNYYKAGSREYESIDAIRSLLKPGARAYVEALPMVSNPMDFHGIVQERVYHQHFSAWTPKRAGGPERVRWVDEPIGGWGGTTADVAARLASEYGKIVAEGDVACGSTAQLRESGYSSAEFI